MILREKNNIPYLTFSVLSEQRFSFVRYAVSTRHGGVSEGEALGSMNLGSKTKDKIENVQKNYTLFCEALDFDPHRVVLGNQTHSLNIRIATSMDAGKGIFKKRDYNDVDALITNEKELPLCIHTADCVPVTLMDTEKKVIGNAHCGWKGTFGELGVKTLQKMQEVFGTNPKDVSVFIGPCIHKCCYEVSESLYREFLEKFKNEQLIFKKDGKFFLDLPGINKEGLSLAGACHVYDSNLCTCCHKADLVSHRGLGAERGIMGAFVMLK